MFKKWCVVGLLSLFTVSVFAQEPLPADEAFVFSYQITAPNKVLLSWKIADGHYLYKQKFKFVSLTPDVQVSDPVFPVAEAKQDKIFGNVEIYRKALALELPLPENEKEIEITYQGCSDEGLCYLSAHKTILITD